VLVAAQTLKPWSQDESLSFSLLTAIFRVKLG